MQKLPVEELAYLMNAEMAAKKELTLLKELAEARTRILSLQDQRSRVVDVLQKYLGRAKDPTYPAVARMAVTGMLEDLLVELRR